MAAEREAAAAGRGHVEVLPAVADLVGWWDRSRLERMLANLVGNALKYNRKGRPIAVIVQRDGDSAVLSVADRGVGLPPAELQDASSIAGIAGAMSDRALMAGAWAWPVRKTPLPSMAAQFI